MTRPSPFSVRGRRALMMMKDERDISILRRQLDRLGMSIVEADPSDTPSLQETIDVIVLDADAIPIKSDRPPALKINAPIIALIGTETPSRLKWLLDLQPASFLIKPLRSAGLYTALVVAFDCAQRRGEEAAHVEKLEERVRSRRVVFGAVLQLMKSHALSEEDAFALIRQTAMRHRTTIEQLSAEIIAAGGMPNRNSRSAYEISPIRCTPASDSRPGRGERAGQIDRPAAGFDHDDIEAEATRVDGGIVDAIVGRESDEEDSPQIALSQITRKPRRRAPVVFVEGGVGIDAGTEALANDEFRALGLQRRMEARARRTLHAMVGPQRLLPIGHLDALECCPARMRRRKGTMTRWMPVLGQHHMLEALGQPIDDRHDIIAVGNGQPAVAAEIVLHVDDQQ